MKTANLNTEKEYNKLMLEREVIDERKKTEYYNKKLDFWRNTLVLSFLALFGGIGIAGSGKQCSKEIKYSGKGAGVSG